MVLILQNMLICKAAKISDTSHGLGEMAQQRVLLQVSTRQGDTSCWTGLSQETDPSSQELGFLNLPAVFSRSV